MEESNTLKKALRSRLGAFHTHQRLYLEEYDVTVFLNYDLEGMYSAFVYRGNIQEVDNEYFIFEVKTLKGLIDSLCNLPIRNYKDID